MGIVDVRQIDEHSFRVDVDSATHEVYLRGDGVSVTGEVQALIAAPAAMQLGLPIRVDLPVSPGFRENFERGQALMSKWFSGYSVARLEADEDRPTRQGTVSFFSGGVDSFASAVAHRHRIDQLVLVHGFDLKLHQTDLRADVSRRIEAAADGLGLPLIQVVTNLRDLTNLHMRWGPHCHGMGLAAVAHALGAATAIIPSSYEYGRLFPWGSHPDLDPLFGSDIMPIEHDGSHLSRVDKVARLVDNDAAMQHLRVCLKNPDLAYNCGRCAKCIRTMINLATAGGLGVCKTLPSTLDLGTVRSLDLRSKGAWTFADENYKRMAQQAENRPVRRALAVARRRARFDNAVRPIARRIPGLRTVRALLRG